MDENLNFHSLRRSYVIHLVEIGYDVFFIQQQVGHEHAKSLIAAIATPTPPSPITSTTGTPNPDPRIPGPSLSRPAVRKPKNMPVPNT